MSATTVLPEPTSPCSSRCIGAGRARSSVISRDRPLLVAGERERQRGVERGHELAVDVVARCPVASRPSARLRGHERELHAEELVELEPAARRAYASAIVSGRWMSRYARRAVDELVRRRAARRRAGRRSPRALRALEARRHRAAQLPRVHLGLPRLRVDRHDGAGDVASPASRIGEHVDDRVRHLALAPVAARPCRTATPACPAAAAARATAG